MSEQVLQESIVRRQHACKANRSNGRVIERLAGVHKGNDKGKKICVTVRRRGSIENGPIDWGLFVNEWFL